MTTKTALKNTPESPAESPETPIAPPSPPTGNADLYSVLEKALQATATDMALALGMEGETFTPPMTTHLRGTVRLTSSGAASLGSAALNRHDGQLEITVVATAGLGLGPAMAVAQAVLKHLPRGTSYPLQHGGQATLRAGQVNPHGEQKDRSRALVVIPFYAFTKD